MKTLNIELFALDLAVCDRCGGTLTNLRGALSTLHPALSTIGVEAIRLQAPALSPTTVPAALLTGFVIGGV